MATNIASKTVTDDPWQLRTLRGDDVLKGVATIGEAAPVAANETDTDALFTGRQHPYFLPRFLPTPDGMEWS